MPSTERLCAKIADELPSEFETVPGTYAVGSGSDFLDDVLHAAERRGADLITFHPQGELVRVCYRTSGTTAEAGRISRAAGFARGTSGSRSQPRSGSA